MFTKILIANRGEIALRIIRTAKRMGIKTVAVYSEADTNAPHVSAADEAVYVGPSPSNQSYLVINNILDAVRRTGAQAVHPGYGFLSENAEFAKALKKEGVIFIGPNIEAIGALGDKIEAKKLAESAKVNTIPGYQGEINDVKEAEKIATKIGYPVMIKAAAGGGGKGMRIVYKKSEVEQAFKSARNEAKKSFSDDRVFIEKYIENPRHIEIQIIADRYGNTVCMGERECSIQRHNQKVIEEAPSPFLDEKTRAKMYEQSVALAKAVKYRSAGTMEFIVDQKKNFYFLEMNTRLQVEHPVTEYITGKDLVELMIRIAYGEKLPFTQEELKITGWAMESRIYAEDPTRAFLPSTGRITEYREPTTGGNVRVDSGVYAGGEVSMFYDAMIAKLITYGKNRDEAIDTMQKSLGEYVISGVTHNISFLEAIMQNPRFRSGDLSTKFIAEEYPTGFSGVELDEEKTRNMLAVGLFIYLRETEREMTISGQLPGRSRQLSTRQVVSVDDNDFPVQIRGRKDGYEIQYEAQRFGVYSEWSLGSRLFQGTVAGKLINAKVVPVTGGFLVTHAGSTAIVKVRTPRVAELAKYMPKVEARGFSRILSAPISGNIVEMKVKVGDKVVPGDELMILEAMKMENIIYAEREAVIEKIHIKQGDNVLVNEAIILFAEVKKTEEKSKEEKPKADKEKSRSA